MATGRPCMRAPTRESCRRFLPCLAIPRDVFVYPFGIPKQNGYLLGGTTSVSGKAKGVMKEIYGSFSLLGVPQSARLHVAQSAAGQSCESDLQRRCQYMRSGSRRYKAEPGFGIIKVIFEEIPISGLGLSSNEVSFPDPNRAQAAGSTPMQFSPRSSCMRRPRSEWNFWLGWAKRTSFG